MLLNIKFLADWLAIRIRKQKQVDTNTTRENRLRVDHDYAVGDQVLITDKDIHSKLDSPTKDPYETVQIYIYIYIYTVLPAYQKR